MTWEDLNPLEFNDGVYYVPARIELQPRYPDWGHPDEPGLRDRVANDRPHGIRGQKLLCLLCMRIRAERGLPHEPVWLTFVEGRHGPMFRHEDGRSPHAEHQPESDIHKAIKERKARTFETAGATSVEVEVWRPRARRRPDVLAVGPELTVAGEVQHSKERPRVIQARQKSLAKAGDRVVWTTDRSGADIDFMRFVPHLSVPALDDYRLYLGNAPLEIGAGAVVFEEQRCGWADMWNGNTTRCPVTRRLVPCGRIHLYPSFNPRTYSRTPSALAALFPCGPRLHLDHILEGILHGQWLPYRIRSQVAWIPAAVHDDVVAERGGGVEQAEAASVRRRDRAAERACERRLGIVPGQREPMDVERAATCCGKHLPGRAGGPIVAACQLCPASPTYWRLG